MTSRRRGAVRPFPPLVPALLVLPLLVPGCTSVDEEPSRPAPAGRPVTAPPSTGGFDYQLGGPYPPPGGVTVVERDRTAEPARLGYDICYVNGFQTQPDESAQWSREQPDLLLHEDGAPLVDPGWPDEFLLDTSTAAKRSRIAGIVGGWIRGCAADGYQAVEVDNLDSHLRSGGRLTFEDDLGLAREYVATAHAAGLAIAQKNSAEHSAALREAGFDFAVTESCLEFQECGSYTEVYDSVLAVEYTDELGESAFTAACDDPGRPGTLVLRDHALVTPADPGYAYRRC